MHGKLILATALCTAAVGCASTTHEAFASFLKAHEHAVSATEIRLNAGDFVRFRSNNVSEIHNTVREIGPDGKVTLALLGEVKVVGLTAKELAVKLEEQLSRYYRDPDVLVRIGAQPSQVFYVVGQVGGAGPYRYTGRDTLLDAIVRARPNNIAWNARVKVIRPGTSPGERREIRVDVNKMVKEGDTRMNVLLEVGDIVYVPPTPLGWVGLKLQEIIYPARPIIQAGTAPAAIRDIPDAYDQNSTGVVAFR